MSRVASGMQEPGQCFMGLPRCLALLYLLRHISSSSQPATPRRRSLPSGTESETRGAGNSPVTRLVCGTQTGFSFPTPPLWVCPLPVPSATGHSEGHSVDQAPDTLLDRRLRVPSVPG